MKPISKLQVYDRSFEAFSAVNNALDAVPDRSGHGYLVNECRRATSSVMSNIVGRCREAARRP